MYVVTEAMNSKLYQKVDKLDLLLATLTLFLNNSVFVSLPLRHQAGGVVDSFS